MHEDNHSDRRWRNRRLTDIATVVAMLAVLMLGYRLMVPRSDRPAQTSFVVPSQQVHW